MQICSGQPVRALDVSDDRLAIVLDALSDPEQRQNLETALNQRIIRVYQLKPQRVRLDSTTASGYWTVSEDGLFQFSYSKDHRPDLPQLKVMLSALDPLGLPLTTQVVAGATTDDPSYLSAIKNHHRASSSRKTSLYFDEKIGELASSEGLYTAGKAHFLKQARIPFRHTGLCIA